MKRHTVKSGVLDQRNRATHKRRRTEVAPALDAIDKLHTWLSDYEAKIENEKTDLGRVDLAQFIIQTQHFDIEPEERLRQLAIALEDYADVLPGLSGWRALERIYDYAAELNPLDKGVWLSRGITAQSLADRLDDKALRKKLYQYKEQAVLRAIELSPNWSRAHYSLGYLYYYQERYEEALKEFELSLNCEDDEQIHGWSNLYRAHCLHDTECWNEALTAYSSVDLSTFSGHNAWRMEALKEDVIECIFHNGDTEKAETLLQEQLTRYEEEPKTAVCTTALWRVAEALSPSYVQRLKAAEDRIY